MTVPDGYFAEFNMRMAASLPQREWERPTAAIKRTRWQKIRPYVYLAAMFMGIWCMMKMFDFIRPSSPMDIADNPVLMSAIQNDDYYYDYCASDMPDSELYDDLYAEGFDPGNLDL